MSQVQCPICFKTFGDAVELQTHVDAEYKPKKKREAVREYDTSKIDYKRGTNAKEN